MSQDFQPLPPPSRGDHYRNTKKRTRKVRKDGPGRPSKDLQQINLKLTPEVKARLIETCDHAIANAQHTTRNDVIGAMLDAFEGSKTIETPEPDKAKGRTKSATVHFNPGLLNALNKVSSKKGQTFSGFLEELVKRGYESFAEESKRAGRNGKS